jgi:hypothetical protein
VSPDALLVEAVLEHWRHDRPIHLYDPPPGSQPFAASISLIRIAFALGLAERHRHGQRRCTHVLGIDAYVVHVGARHDWVKPKRPSQRKATDWKAEGKRVLAAYASDRRTSAVSIQRASRLSAANASNASCSLIATFSVAS